MWVCKKNIIISMFGVVINSSVEKMCMTPGSHAQSKRPALTLAPETRRAPEVEEDLSSRVVTLKQTAFYLSDVEGQE